MNWYDDSDATLHDDDDDSIVPVAAVAVPTIMVAAVAQDGQTFDSRRQLPPDVAVHTIEPPFQSRASRHRRPCLYVC